MPQRQASSGRGSRDARDLRNEERHLPVVSIDANTTYDYERLGALVFTRPGIYRFETDWSAAETAVFAIGPGIVLDLNGHTIEFGASDLGGCCGVNPWMAFSRASVGANDSRFASVLQKYDYRFKGATVRIRNGTIRWRGQTGEYAACIGGHYCSAVEIENCELHSGGRDGSCVHLMYGNAKIAGCVLTDAAESTNNRHQAPSNVTVGGVCEAADNILVGGNSGFKVESQSVLRRNLIRQASFATNGYGVFLYRTEEVVVEGNLIVPTNGRGVLVNGIADDSTKSSGRNRVTDNVILALDRPNEEYGETLTCTCYRSRYATQGDMVTGNHCLAIGGTGLTSAKATYLSNEAPGRNQYRNNRFAGILRGPIERRKLAAAISLEGQGDYSEREVAQDDFRDNHFLSNCYLMMFSHTDGGCYQSRMHACHLSWTNGRTELEAFQEAMARRFEFKHPSACVARHRPQVLQEINEQLEDLLGEETEQKPGAKTFYAGYAFPSAVTVELANEFDQIEPEDVELVSDRYDLEITIVDRHTLSKPAGQSKIEKLPQS